MNSWRARVSPWVPPALSTWAARRAPSGNVFTEYAGTWEEAVASVRGYGDTAIIERVADATRAVERREAAFERDSVLFDEPQYSWPLVAALTHAAARDGRLHVIDFGGALGSTYRQHRPFLDDLPDVRWAVVEQADFVRIGRGEFTTDRLTFHDSIDEASGVVHATVVLFGSSLQYLPEPGAPLVDAARTPARTLVIDRTPLSDRPTDVITIQTVPPSIYRAAYPMWVLSRSRLLERSRPAWEVVASYESGFGRIRTTGGIEFGWDGLILER